MSKYQRNVQRMNLKIIKHAFLLIIILIYTITCTTFTQDSKSQDQQVLRNLEGNHRKIYEKVLQQKDKKTDYGSQLKQIRDVQSMQQISSSRINQEKYRKYFSENQQSPTQIQTVSLTQQTISDLNQQFLQETHEQSHYYHPYQLKFWVNILVAVLLTVIGAFCSGMTVGLMSIQTIQLQIMSLSNDEKQKTIAQRILSVTSNHHLFLVTLLLANAMALQTLPIIIHFLMPAWAAILFSTVIVLIAAEIIPQAFCTGPKKITVAYHASPIILIMIKILWILAYPMSKGLDYLLGEHHHHRIQHKDFANFLTRGSQTLKSTQKLILTSILQLRTKRVPQIMIPLQNLYMLQLNQKLTPSKIKQLDSHDYSYILVYKDNKQNTIGVLKMKQFALKYLKQRKRNLTVSDLFIEKQNILCVYEDTNLLQMLMLFQARSQRFSIVIGKKRKVQPGIQSIMYSKSDMVSSKQQGEILGVVFLYSLFQSIAEYDAQVGKSLDSKKYTPIKQQSQVEMTNLNKPLLKH